MKVKSESEVSQSCQTLSNPMDCRLPGSSVHGIFQARVLEWGAIAFSNVLLIFTLFCCLKESFLLGGHDFCVCHFLNITILGFIFVFNLLKIIFVRYEGWIKLFCISSVQFSSVTQSCLTLCDPMNRSTPGLPVHHQLPEFTRTHVH